jgi:hypothetical protein
MDTSRYRGGRGEQGDVPVLFFLTEDMLNGSTSSEKSKNKTKEETGVLSSTSSLLNKIQQDSNESTIQELNLSSQNQPLKSSMSVRLPGDSTSASNNAEGSAPSASTARKSKLVQELDENRNVVASNEDDLGGGDEKTPILSSVDRDKDNDKGLFGKVCIVTIAPGLFCAFIRTNPRIVLCSTLHRVVHSNSV